jgi:uncharacterized membrane protein
MPTFSIQESLSFAWRTFIARSGIFISVGIVSVGIFAIEQLVQWPFDGDGETLSLIWWLGFAVSLAISFLFSMGITAFYLKAHKDVASVHLKDLWHPHPYINYVWMSLAGGILVLLGFVLLVIPGIILSILFMFSAFLVIERNLGPIEALKESARMTKGNRWNLFLLSVVLTGINILGALGLLVGLFITVPVTLLALVHAYRTLERTTA